jgi:hypothetical protein
MAPGQIPPRTGRELSAGDCASGVTADAIKGHWKETAAGAPLFSSSPIPLTLTIGTETQRGYSRDP